MKDNLSEALRIYARARSYVSEAGLESEISWQRSRDWKNFTERDFLCQSAWVILCGGFKESIIRNLFDHISLCFCDWESAAAITESADACAAATLRVFKNRAKVNAIVEMADEVNTRGFDCVRQAIHSKPIAELQRFSYIGPITAIHLAKNLGLNIAKPDRHLIRLTQHVGFRCADELCSAIADTTGEKANVVDLVLWRYLADIRWNIKTPKPSLA